MKKLFKSFRFFNVYKKNILKNETYLSEKYGLEFNTWFELYTTIDLSDAPQNLIDQYGSALAEHEIKKYINSFNNDLPKLELEELVNLYEIKKINDLLYGVAFGYSLMNNRKLLSIKMLTFILLCITTIGGIIHLTF